MADDTLREIENEMRELIHKKNISYSDYLENRGNREDAECLYDVFEVQKNRWNELVKKRNELLNS